MNGLLKLLFAGVFIYATITMVLYFFQSSLIYYPNLAGRELTVTPQQIGLAYEEINFVASDGIELHGWFVPAVDAKGNLLFFHGNAGNISHRLDSIELFNTLGLNVFIIDYRGYGQSQGKPGEAGTYKDADAAWRYLTETRGIDARQIIIFGRSLGASIAAWLASQQQSAGLIIESGFSSITSMAHRLYPYLPVKWLTRFSYDTASYISTVKSPILVIHSPQDEVVPYDEGRAIFDAATAEKNFLEIQGGHNDGFLVSGQAYLNGLSIFTDASLQHQKIPDAGQAAPSTDASMNN